MQLADMGRVVEVQVEMPFRAGQNDAEAGEGNVLGDLRCHSGKCLTVSDNESGCMFLQEVRQLFGLQGDSNGMVVQQISDELCLRTYQPPLRRFRVLRHHQHHRVARLHQPASERLFLLRALGQHGCHRADKLIYAIFLHRTAFHHRHPVKRKLLGKIGRQGLPVALVVRDDKGNAGRFELPDKTDILGQKGVATDD